MKWTLSVVAGLAIASALPGQMPPVQVTAGANANGGPIWLIANTGAVAVTAVAIVRDVPQPNLPGRTVRATTDYDVALGTAAEPILPGKRIEVRANYPSNEAVPVFRIRAVLFGDGSSWGDAAYVQMMTANRRFMLKRLQEAYDELNQALAAGTSRESLTAQLQAEVDNRTTAAADPGDQLAIRSARSLALVNLRMAHMTLAKLLQQQMGILNIRMVALRTYGGVQ